MPAHIESISGVGRPPIQRENACGLLVHLLADGEWHVSNEIIRKIQEEGISRQTITRARKMVGVEVKQIYNEQGERHWMMRLENRTPNERS